MDSQENAKRKWAIFIYMAADNDLSQHGLDDIKELCQVGSSNKTHIAVEIDTKGNHGSTRYEISKPDWDERSYPMIIDQLPEQNSGKPRTFKAFLEWAFHRYEAEHYIVVVWGHGSGFRGKYKDVASDEGSYSALNIAEIENIFSNLFQDPRFAEAQQKLELLAFDACLMNLLEVAHHFQDIAHYMVGSQHKIPDGGWFYDKVLMAIKKRELTIQELLHVIVDEYVENHSKNGEKEINQAAIATKDTAKAMETLHELGTVLHNYIADNRKLRKQILDIRIDSQFFKNAFQDYIDACHFTNMLIEQLGESDHENQIKAKAASFIEAIQHCIVYHGKGSGLVKATGLSIWFPTSASIYIGNVTNYRHLIGMEQEKTGWLLFLHAFHVDYSTWT